MICSSSPEACLHKSLSAQELVCTELVCDRVCLHKSLSAIEILGMLTSLAQLAAKDCLNAGVQVCYLYEHAMRRARAGSLSRARRTRTARRMLSWWSSSPSRYSVASPPFLATLQPRPANQKCLSNLAPTRQQQLSIGCRAAAVCSLAPGRNAGSLCMQVTASLSRGHACF
jgi:hypothetical protein